MRKNDRKRLQDKLAKLSEAERSRLYKLAAKMRKASQARPRIKKLNISDVDLNDHDNVEPIVFEKRTGRDPMLLEDWVLKLLDKEQREIARTTPPPPTNLLSGIVIAVRAGVCRVLHQHQQYKCILRPELAIAQRSDLSVGDEVDFSTSNDETYIVEQVRPRRSCLSRPDPYDPRLERVIAANIDFAIIVVSIKSPSLSTKLIDRYLLAVERGGVKPLICVNKIDLLSPEEHSQYRTNDPLKPYEKLGIQILHCSAMTGEGINTLLTMLSGKLGVLVGHSGVGKSSIINAVSPELSLVTGSVRGKSKKGRHTTAVSAMYKLPQDVRIIDTPGIRGFGLWKMEPEELRWYFNEFDPFSPMCKFSDCSHVHEPDCAVRQAVERGEIVPARYESYRRILDTLMDDMHNAY